MLSWPPAENGFVLTRTPHFQRDMLKKYLGDNVDTEEGCALFCMHNSLLLSKVLLYVSTMPKGEAEGILAFVVTTGQCYTALNGVHCYVDHQSQQRKIGPQE